MITVIEYVFNKYRHIHWPIVDQIFVSGGNFLTIAICANFLPLNEQGKFGYIYAWYIGTIILNASLLFQHASVKAPSEASKSEYRGRLAIFQIFVAISSSLLIALTVLGLSSIDGLSLTVPEIVLMTFFLCFQQIADFSRRSAYIFESAKVSAKLSMVQYFLRISLLGIVAPVDLSTVLLILLVTSFWSVRMTISIVLQEKIALDSMRKFVCGHASESKWFIASGPAMWFCASMPIFFLGGVVDAAAMAVFFSIRSLANIGNVAMELLETEFSARIGRYWHEGAEKVKDSVKMLRVIGVAVWAVGFMLIIFLGDLVVEVVFGASYKDYSWLLSILWLSNGVVFLYRVNGVHLRTVGKSDIVARSYSLSALVMLLVGIPLIAAYGLQGGAGLVVIGAAMILFGQYWFSKPTYTPK